uniref:BED-type domain-containing protein n=1 Tax=Kalanchoe fedtschenkoi TaxID=63787 RepID=A0A7N0V537_KALFE
MEEAASVSTHRKITHTHKKNYNTRSNMWDHFQKMWDESGQTIMKSKCNYCLKEYVYNSSHGTTTLRRHLMDRCEEYPYGSKRRNMMIQVNQGSKLPPIPSKFDQEFCRQALARMIIVDELPFKCVEREGFNYFISALQPLFKMPSRITVAKDCYVIYTHEKVILKKLINGLKTRISLTTDIWTSVQNIAYLCLTAHFIDDDWNLHKRILNFCQVPSHKGKDIGATIELCLIGWGIEKLCTITVDNASSNDVAVDYLRKKFNKRNNLILNGEFMHMRCCAHILNLIVKDGLTLMEQSVTLIRKAVKYVRSSPARLQHFKTCVEQERIQCGSLVCLDVPTRWNSTYLMLESVLKLYQAFERLEEQDPHLLKELKPNGLKIEWKWEKLQTLCKFLKKFYDATNIISGTLYVTSNLFFHEMVSIGNLMIGGYNDYLLQSMVEPMREKYEKYWKYSSQNFNVMILVAILMDPRYKVAYIEFCYRKFLSPDEVDGLLKTLKGIMKKLLDYYQAESSSCISSSSRDLELEVDQFYDVSGSQESLRDEFLRHLEQRDSMSRISELDKYLNDPLESIGLKFDILGWWKNNLSNYPILALIVKDVLAIPVSTVASESAFSTGGRVLDPFRSSLSPMMVQCLVCAQDWIRSSPSPINVEDSLNEVEELEACGNV